MTTNRSPCSGISDMRLTLQLRRVTACQHIVLCEMTVHAAMPFAARFAALPVRPANTNSASRCNLPQHPGPKPPARKR
jgi:hypothetical protein